MLMAGLTLVLTLVFVAASLQACSPGVSRVPEADKLKLSHALQLPGQKRARCHGGHRCRGGGREERPAQGCALLMFLRACLLILADCIWHIIMCSINSLPATRAPLLERNQQDTCACVLLRQQAVSDVFLCVAAQATVEVSDV